MAKKTYSQHEVDEIIKNFKKDRVTLLFIGAISSGTTVALGKLGSFNRAGMMIEVSKELFLANLGVPVVDDLLRKRQIIVVNGLDKNEQVQYGLDYKQGELLTQQMFYRILDLPKKEICDIYSKLCESHRDTVSKLYVDAYFNGDNRINIETVKELNDISKKLDKKGKFTLILKDYGEKIAE